MSSSPSFAYAGTHSPRLKAARRLAKRAFRDRDRAFLAEGPQAVAEAFASGATITDLFVTAAAQKRHAALVEAIAAGTSGPAASASELRGRPAAEAPGASRPGEAVTARSVAIHLVNDTVMAELAQTVTPQGLLAVCGFVDVPLDQALAGKPSLVVVLANVRDPGNAGTVLRTADAAGAGAVVFADASVDPYNSKCVRASAGSLFHLPVVTGIRLADAVTGLHAAGLLVIAADGGADRWLDDVGVTRSLARPTAWLFGNEAWGLPPELVAMADEAVAVPIYGRAESLNLATAAAVCLYASAHAQRVSGNGV